MQSNQSLSIQTVHGLSFLHAMQVIGLSNKKDGAKQGSTSNQGRNTGKIKQSLIPSKASVSEQSHTTGDRRSG